MTSNGSQTWARRLTLLLATLGPSCDPPPVGSVNYVGSAEVRVGERLEGQETHTVLGEDGAVLCEERYTLAGDPSQSCEDCTWAFEADISEQETLDGAWCEDLAVGVDGWTEPLRLGLGFAAELEQIAWKSGRYDWELVPYATVSWEGDDAAGTLGWDWNEQSRLYYGYE